MNDPKPEPGKVIEATRRITDSDFAQEFPETKRLEEQMQEYARIIRGKIQDHERALQHVLDMLDAMEKAKKP